MNGTVAIVIVNWNAGKQLQRCISSILEFAPSVANQVIIIDNGSGDNSLSSVERLVNVKIIRAGENLGFGRACNLGAMHSDSEYLLFLNPDAELYQESLQATLRFMQEPYNDDVAICGIRLIDKLGQTSRGCARFPSAVEFIAKSLGLDQVFPGVSYVMNEWDHDETRRVDHVIGAYYFVRRSLFQALQGFDEQFFVYLEDLDFSLRAKKAGWACAYFADASAFHAGGGVSEQVRAIRLFYSLQSRFLYVFKHFKWPSAVAVVLATLLVEPIVRSVHALICRSWSTLKETLIAYGKLSKWGIKRIVENHG